MAITVRSEKGKRSSTPRGALSRERIVAAALELADTRGDFSMRALGQKLKVDPMAIYRHFRDKEELIDASVDAALSGIRLPSGDDRGAAVERLRQLCLDFRTALSAHPGIAIRVSTAEPSLGPHTVALADVCLGLFFELGLDSSAATHALLVVIRFITGVVAAEERVRAAGGTEAAWRDQMRAGYASVSSSAHPNIAQMANEIGQLSFQEDFEYGLDLILEGLADRGEACRARGSGAPQTAST